MKKIAFLIVSLVFGLHSFAQDSTSQVVTFDLHIGGAYTTIHEGFATTSNADISNNLSITGGAGVNFRLSDKLGLKTGMDYSLLGSTFTGYLFNLNYTKKVDLNLAYLSIPLLASYQILTPNLSVLAGPQFNILLSSSSKVQDGSKFNIKSSFNSSDWLAVGGFEYKLNVGKKQLFISPRYNFGLSNIVKDISTNSNNTMHNRAITATVGYIF